LDGNDLQESPQSEKFKEILKENESGTFLEVNGLDSERDHIM
jgi:hypothetical protein